ncbi:hypothetical protein FRB91_011945 [Serendipita sp. 411]|nr:hypothetical protein FRB91_011945 [Serendipita sp. 411]
MPAMYVPKHSLQNRSWNGIKTHTTNQGSNYPVPMDADKLSWIKIESQTSIDTSMTGAQTRDHELIP